MNSILGPAPILDFDGTLAVLSVDWQRLRDQLGVRRLEELWAVDARAWEVVASAETEAATLAHPVAPLIEHLASARCFAVLSSNSERAVWRFLERFEHLRARTARVVGRETLRGPKTRFDVFAEGFAECSAATQAARENGPAVYVGDAAYELDFAHALGATAVNVRDLPGGVAPAD